ncbi:hypothetical protein AV530_003035 [Patagioenas fasciata monilis]|uniref:Uncharacterized protein n=1 Tax=Patagioenas fasciata monilis TaxID=372326 RepID=A0A1V4KVL7_PATFA|nr:hypothetical protein AV530_003035 [Patagioenas fasciata monilis]
MNETLLLISARASVPTHSGDKEEIRSLFGEGGFPAERFQRCPFQRAQSSLLSPVFQFRHQPEGRGNWPRSPTGCMRAPLEHQDWQGSAAVHQQGLPFYPRNAAKQRS